MGVVGSLSALGGIAYSSMMMLSGGAFVVLRGGTFDNDYERDCISRGKEYIDY